MPPHDVPSAAPPPAPVPTGVTIPAADGYPLHARLWARPGETSPRRVALVNAGAGIVCAYYERFAAWLAASGTPTLVYDYRGIGGSRPATLRGFDATVEDWGRLDCSGALAWLEARYPAAERLVVGHSVGGFVTGLSTVGAQIDRLLLVGAHSGYCGDYASRARPWMYVLWHVLMPALTRIVGYFPGRRLHLLEDLPRGAALQWAGRRHPDFRDDDDLRLPDGRRDEARGEALHGRFRAVRADTLALRFTDDPFATEAATANLQRLYVNATWRTRELSPADAGGGPIGHFGFFRSRHRDTLWPVVAAWLERH
jgi:predicted alpha/beta hydrolase